MTVNRESHMPLQAETLLVSAVERKLTTAAICRFLFLRQATPRQDLVSVCHDPNAIDRSLRFGLLTDIGTHNYAPTVLGFELCADPDVLLGVRTSTERILRVLRKLAEDGAIETSLTPKELSDETIRMFGDVSQDDLKTGVFLAAEFPVFASYNKDVNGVELTRVSISDRIFIALKELDHAWDRHVASRRIFLDASRSPERRRVFLSNLHRLSGDKRIDVPLNLWFRAAYDSGFQHDEIDQLIDDCMSDGVLLRNVKTDDISFTDAAFARERERAIDLTTTVKNGSVVFISCGQCSEEEKELGKQVASMVRAFGFEPFFAEEVHDLDGLDTSILRALHDCAAFITVLHPRGEITTPEGKTITRASVWIEQEIAIAAYIQRVEKRKLRVIAFKHNDVSLEGLRSLLHLNPIPFAREADVVLKLPEQLKALGDLQLAVTEEEEQSADDWQEHY